MIIFLITLGCTKDQEEVVLEQVFEIALDGDSFDPYERYAKITSFAGEKWVDGKLRKIVFITKIFLVFIVQIYINQAKKILKINEKNFRDRGSGFVVL